MHKIKNDSNDRLMERNFVGNEMANGQIVGEITGKQYENASIFNGSLFRDYEITSDKNDEKDEKVNSRIFDIVINNDKNIMKQYQTKKLIMNTFIQIINNINLGSYLFNNLMNDIFDSSYIFSPIALYIFMSILYKMTTNKINKIIIEKKCGIINNKLDDYINLMKRISINEYGKVIDIIMFNEKINISETITKKYENIEFIKINKKYDSVFYKKKINKNILKISNNKINTKPPSSLIKNNSISGLLCTYYDCVINNYSYSNDNNFMEFRNININFYDGKIKIYEFECCGEMKFGIIDGDLKNDKFENIFLQDNYFNKVLVKKIIIPKINIRKKIKLDNILKKYEMCEIFEDLVSNDRTYVKLSGLISDIELNVSSIEHEKNDIIDAIPNIENILVVDKCGIYIKDNNGVILLFGTIF